MEIQWRVHNAGERDSMLHDVWCIMEYLQIADFLFFSSEQHSEN